MRFKTAIASTSASTARRAAGRWLPLAALLACSLSSAAVAGPKLETFQGHICLGYGKLLPSEGASPGGSLSFAGGVEYPIRPGWSAGIEIGYWLLGTRLVERGSLGAELDYSVFETVALARWKPQHTPLEVTIGPGIFHGRADLTSSGAAGFGDLAVEETVGGVALGVTVIQSRPAPVRVGIELASRWLWLPGDEFGDDAILGQRLPNWTLVAARLAIHY
jgi:hypothetical protein